MQESQAIARNNHEANAVETMDAEETYPSFLGTLSDGFQYLRSKREGESENPPGSILPTFLHTVSVNFIDPTTSSIATTSTTTHQPVQLYEKFCEIFERDYQSTLSYVPYELFRNNANGVIERLPIRTVVARSHGGGVLLPDDDAAKSAVHDYSWERPFCYVYLAACESLEHYRTKVKPSIQAFVSQLEAANRTKSRRSSGAATTANGVPADSVKTRKRYTSSPRYVIIYVPTGDRSDDAGTSSGAAAVNTSKNTGLASRFAAAARQRMSSGGSTRGSDTASVTDSSIHSTIDSAHGNEDESGNAGSNSQKLTRTERETAKRFSQDFPAGNVCTLSHLAGDGTPSDSAWDKLEWNTAMKAIGAAIAGGFQDRCHRFDDELRKLDLQRRGDAKPTSDEDTTRFHLVNFFLVKESLAFTYEQMRLPGEALLQYEELRAFIPDTEPRFGLEGDELALLRVALSADVLEFRSILRTRGEFDETSASVLEEYVFARELALLFQMHKAVRIAKRAHGFIRGKFNALRPMADTEGKLIWLFKHCFGFCWDFQTAIGPYIDVEKNSSNYYMAFSRCLCDLLEFARTCLLSLGQKVIEEGPIVKSGDDDVFAALCVPWVPWSERVETVTPQPSQSFDYEGPFLQHALSSTESFRWSYLELTSHLAEFNDLCGRHRYAARVRLERTDMYISVGEKRKAADELHSLLDVYEQDSWSHCQFSLLFRLAMLHREFNSASDYLGVLVRCFSKSLSNVARKKAMGVLHEDLLQVVSSETTNGDVFPCAPLFGPIFGLEGIVSQNASGSDRSLLKRLYTLGDMVSVTLSLSSFLPRPVTLDGATLHLVPFQVYVAAMEDNLPIKDSDATERLDLGNPVLLDPGENMFTLEWVPLSPGQYIVASCSLRWGEVGFTYAARELKRPTIRIDIVPGKPAHCFEASPPYLLLGHEQTLRFELSAKSDTVQGGELVVRGPPGVELKKDEQSSEWMQSIETTLPACLPNKRESVALLAKATHGQSSDTGIPPLEVTLSTTYKCTGNETESELMEHTTQLKIPVRSAPLLTMVSSAILPCEPGKSILSVTLECNTPAPFEVKDWTIRCSPFKATNAKMNEDLRGEAICSGDKIFFCFPCTYGGTNQDVEASLLVTVENNNHDSFTETIPLPDLVWPKMHSTTKISSSEKARVNTTISKSAGSVGEPVELVYSIECSTIPKGVKDVCYEIDFDNASWVISGAVGGQVDQSKETFNVKTIAIPVQPGETTGAPTLSLFSKTPKGASPIATHCSPIAFTAGAIQRHSSVAYPIKMINNKRGSQQGKSTP